MKIDLVGPERRGLALGLNESAGYGGVALAAALSGWLAAEFVARDVLVVGGAVVAVAGSGDHGALRPRHRGPRRPRAGPPPRSRPSRRLACAAAFPDASYRLPALRACSQAGLVNNLNDALDLGTGSALPRRPRRQHRRDRARGRDLPGGLGPRPDLDRSLVGQRRSQAADRRRDADPGRGACSCSRPRARDRRWPLSPRSYSALEPRSSTRP